MGDWGWPWEGAHGTMLQGNGWFYSSPTQSNWTLESKPVSWKLITHCYCLEQDLLLNFHLIDCTHVHVHINHRIVCWHLSLPHSTRTASFPPRKTLQAVTLTLFCTLVKTARSVLQNHIRNHHAEPCRTAVDNAFYFILIIHTPVLCPCSHQQEWLKPAKRSL